MAEFFHHRLWADPLVCVVCSGRDELWPGVVYSSLVAAGRPARIMIIPFQPLESHLPRITEVIERAGVRFPKFQFTISRSDADDERLGRSRGIDTFVCNLNSFLDERLVYPEPNVPKLYDAVYNGRIVPSKRHHLAVQVSRLAIITGGYEVDAGFAAAMLGQCAI